jgi:hypothetical protein
VPTWRQAINFFVLLEPLHDTRPIPHADHRVDRWKTAIPLEHPDDVWPRLSMSFAEDTAGDFTFRQVQSLLAHDPLPRNPNGDLLVGSIKRELEVDLNPWEGVQGNLESLPGPFTRPLPQDSLDNLGFVGIKRRIVRSQHRRFAKSHPLLIANTQTRLRL